MKIPVGWECIEVFPFPDISMWKPEYAPIWAENDLLANVVSEQLRDQHFSNLDPQVVARKMFLDLLNEYKKLLDSEPENEEILQKFLNENPILVCPTKIDYWPKKAIGSYITDFIFKEAEGDYLLVEIEPSCYKLFNKNGDVNYRLNHARDQITNWRRYIEDNLKTVQNELDLPGISSNPRCLIIIGRLDSLDDDNKRKLMSMENVNPRVKIMTYDDLYNRTKAVVENMFGSLWFESGNTEIYYIN